VHSDVKNKAAVGHVWEKAREHATNAFIGGSILVLTGFTPEHWVAEIFHKLHLPEGLTRWASGVDLRVALVGLGIAVMVVDALWRRRRKDAAGATAGRGGASAPPPALPLPDKPSIAVLPFTNLSGDPAQDYFSDGIVEDIITALSRFRTLFVIARNSSFTYKGRPVDVKRVGQELGVRYVLEGSVRKADNHVRISGQLIDAATGAHLWAERFDGALDRIFDLQDQITSSVVGAIAPKLEQAEMERAKLKPTGSLDAYDHYLRGLARFYELTAPAQDDALRFFRTATQIDPNFGAAFGMAAWCHAQRKANGWMLDPAKDTAEAAQLARRAVQLGREDAIALCSGGFALAYVADDLDGIGFVERALVLNPNLAAAWYLSGRLHVRLGRPDEAIAQLARAMRLSPLDPLMVGMLHTTGVGHFLSGRYEEALSWVGKALAEQPDYLPSLRIAAASYGLLGRADDAGAAVARLRQADPSIRIANLKDYSLISRPEDFAKYAEGLRKAGLQE
jgi:TolB-like protein